MNPFAWLFLLFLLVPLVEIYLLILVGNHIGALPTILMVVVTAVVGVYLLRLQGFSTLQRVRGALAQGQVPAVEMLEGVMLVVAGALLLTPGFFTDALGFLALVPGLRRAVATRFMARASVDSFVNVSESAHTTHTIEGEFDRDDETK